MFLIFDKSSFFLISLKLMKGTGDNRNDVHAKLRRRNLK